MTASQGRQDGTWLKDLQLNWDLFGRLDPFWAIYALPGTRGGRWTSDEFFRTGGEEIAGTLNRLKSLGIALYYRRALDFGCGAGRLTQALSQYFEHVDGVDIAPSMIRLAERFNRHRTKCRYHLNDAPNLRLFGNDQFDFVYSAMTLQHIPPVFAWGYIEELLRVLRPNGVLIFQLPSSRLALESPPKDLLASVKRAIKYAMPGLVNLYRRSLRRPEMRMYAIPREEIHARIRSLDVTLVDVQPDTSAGSEWDSYRYTAIKRT